MSVGSFIQEENKRSNGHRYLLLYEDDAYGRGLRQALESNFHSTNLAAMVWCGIISSPNGSQCINHTVDPRLYDEIAKGQLFSASFVAAFEESEYDSVVLLGTSIGALAIAKGIETFQARPNYYFVGGNKILFDEAPTNSVTIAEPVLDPGRAPNAEVYFEWSSLLDELESKHAIDRSDFVSTTYEAGMVLHGALKMIFRDKEMVPQIGDLRRDLLTVLAEHEFDALDPWRRIRFADGQLAEPPAAPIYRLGRGQSREDTSQSQPWVEIDVLPRHSLLESPIHVQLRGYSIDSARVLLSRVTDKRTTLAQIRDVNFSGGEAEVDFHVFRPGIYNVSIDGANYRPSSAGTEVIMTPVYLLSCIAALIGAWIVLSREKCSMQSRLGRIAMGIFAGFVLTFSSLYGNSVAGWFPFPSFGDEPVINAIITGFIGGLIGPYMLTDVFLSWAEMLLMPIGGHRNARNTSDVVDLPRRRKIAKT